MNEKKVTLYLAENLILTLEQKNVKNKEKQKNSITFLN